MKRITITAVLAGCLALVPMAAAQGETVGSTLKVKYKAPDPDDPYGTGESQFKGTVGPEECAKGRKVTITDYGKEKTDARGRFKFVLSKPAKPGTYKVKVAEKEIRGVTCSKVKTKITIG